MYLDKLRKKQNLLFASIIGVTGLIVRIYLETLLPTGWDVGHYLYWGEFVLNGQY